MSFLISFLTTKVLGFFLMLANDEAISFGIYDIEKSLTPVGWAAVIFLPLALIFGIIYVVMKTIKKRKIK